jgi:hypothetical protein
VRIFFGGSGVVALRIPHWVRGNEKGGNDVTILKRVLKTVKHQAGHADNYVRNCLTGTQGGTMPVAEFGDAQTHTYGYPYFDGTSTHYTTALDVDTSSTPGAYLQKVSRGCVTGNTGGNP